MVAAAAAWLRAAKPGYRADQVAQALRASARDLGPKGWDSATGYGMLSVLGALSSAAPAIDPHEPNDDMAWINGKATGRVDTPIWRRGVRASCAPSSTSTRTRPTSTGSCSPRVRACACPSRRASATRTSRHSRAAPPRPPTTSS